MRLFTYSVFRRMSYVFQQDWDALLSLSAMVIFWIVFGTSTISLSSAQPWCIGALFMGLTTSLAAFVAGRWENSHFLNVKTAFAACPPGKLRVYMLYFLLVIAGIDTAGLGFILTFVGSGLSRAFAVTFYGLLFGFAWYCLLGLINLMLISRRYDRDEAILRARAECISRETRLNDNSL